MNELLWWFGQNTLAALLMIPCVMLACRLFRDRPAVQHLLWLVILLKFVTPPIVVWPWSVDELRHMAWPQVSDQQRASLEPSPVASKPELIEPRIVPNDTTMIPNEPAPNLEPSSLPADIVLATDQANEMAQPTAPTNWSRSVTTTTILAWIIGAIVCCVNQLRRLKSYAHLVRSGEAAPPNLKAEVASVASLLRMKAPVSVVVKGIVSPFLWCVGHARLAWPDSLSSQADVTRSRGIIAHELAHLRRRDHWITWLELGASMLWWWNPLFWFVRRQLRETAEMSCDALAIAANPEGRREYAELLLRLSSQTTNGVPVPVIAMGAGNVASFERRLRMILSSNVSGKLSWRGALTMAVLAVIALPYWSLAQSATDPTEVETIDIETASGTEEQVQPWEISKLYDAAFLRKYLQDHEALPKPIVVPAVRGKVLDPNGKPATGVNLVSYTPRQGVTINPLKSGGVKKSKQDGTFGLPERTEPYRVLLTHESGVANVSHEELLRAHGVIRLQKWASVTGTLKLDGKPQAGETIVLQIDTLPWSYSRDKLTIIHRTTSDKDGNFSFDRVPPLGGIAHARALGGTVYQCESGKNTHIEIGVGRTVTGKLQLPEHIQKSKLQVYARNHLLPIPYPKDWTDQVTQSERDAWRIKWLQTAEGYEYADSNYVLVNSSVPGSIADDGTFTMYGVPERPMVLVVLLPGEGILLEQPFDTSNAPSNALNLGTVTVSDTRLQRENLHDHQHEDVNQGGQVVGQPYLPKLIVRTIDSKGTPVPNTWVRFYDRNSQRAGEKEAFEMVNKRTDESGVVDFGVMPNSFGCLQLSPSNKELAECYTLISATMIKCTEGKPPRANVQTEIKEGILTVTFTMTPHVDLEFNIVDDATNEIVFWSEIFYQDPTTNRWWQFGLVDGSQTQHNFIPISPQITRETIRISALGYETKVFRLPDELDRSKPIRRDVRLKPMPDVELKVLLPDGKPAEKAKLTFHYPNELDCLQDHEELSDAKGIVTTKFPPSADIGIFRFEHAGGTAELSMKELLDDVKQNPGKVINRSIQLSEFKQQDSAAIKNTVTKGDQTEKSARWIPARPLKTTVSAGTASILKDQSIRLEGDVAWQEVTAHFAFDKATTVDELRLELLPIDTSAGRQLGRGGEQLVLADVKAGVKKQTGEWKSHDFSECISRQNPNDETTANCIDYLSDTDWTVPALSADTEAHALVLRFDEPVTLQPGEQLVLSVDSGGAKKLAVLNRIRFAFHQAVAEPQNDDSASVDRPDTGTVVLHAIDADTGEPIRAVAFVKENSLREDWATPIGKSDADGTVRIDTKPLPGYFFSILPVPEGYKVSSLDEVPAHVEVGSRVDYRFYLRKLGTNLGFVKNVASAKAAGNRFAEALRDTDQKSCRMVIDDMPGFRGQPVTFSFARDRAPQAERIFANGELVRAAVQDELRYFEKTDGKLAGKISELRDIQVVISSSTLPTASATSWYLHFRTKDGIELKQEGFRIRFEDLDHWDLEIPSFLHPEF